MGELKALGNNATDEILDLLRDAMADVACCESYTGAMVVLVDGSGFCYGNYARMTAADVVVATSVMKSRCVQAMEEYQESYEDDEE